MAKSKYYLAGPMTGIPQFNYPAFREATKHLRSQGLDIISPVEQDSAKYQELAIKSKNGHHKDVEETGDTWGDILAKDVKIVADEVDGVVVLPGWSESRGARLEVFVALNCQKPVFFYDRQGIVPFPELTIMDLIKERTLDQGDVQAYG